jgi:cell division protein FtsB
MRIVIYSMLLLLLAIQYPLWLGKGGWLKVYEMERQLELQQAKNSLLSLRNAKLTGDVKDLKDGTSAIEERARVEHGMIKDGEFFVQILPPAKPPETSPKQTGPQ